MKKIFTLVVFSLFAVATIHAEMVLAFEMQTNKASGSTISLGFVAGGARTVGVDWGDGNIVTYTSISNTITAPTTTSGTTTVNQAIIKVYVDGSAITNLVCSGNGLISLDLSRANGLTRLTVSNNNLTTLDVSNHTLLQQLISIGGYNTCFRGIDLSANTALTALTIRNGGLKYAKDLDFSYCINLNALSIQNDGSTNANTLNACAMDSVYTMLSDRTGKSVGTIFVGNSAYVNMLDNDYNGSDKTIAIAKNWTVKTTTNNAVLTGDGGGCMTTDIIAQSTKSNFSLYPNPTRGQVQINVVGETAGRQLQVMDITGRLIHERAITSAEMTLDTSGFPKGVYLISTGRNIQKLVVE